MNITPIRHMFFLAALLFVILSSGSLQCALNCYDRAAQCSSSAAQAADCHPLILEELAHSPEANFCHHGDAAADVGRDPILRTLGSGQFLALFPSRCESPEYRSAEPFKQTFVALSVSDHAEAESLPLSQNLKQLRSTILLI